VWRASEPLYQRGILKPKKEVVNEPSLTQIVVDAAKTYKNIQEGLSGLKGDIRPLSRADIKLIESAVADEKLTADKLVDAAKTYRAIQSGQPTKQAPAFTIFKSEIAELMLKEKPAQYFIDLRKLAEELGYRELILEERLKRWGNTKILDLNEMGDIARVKTFYKGKKSFSVEGFVNAEEIPERVWESFEEAKTQRGREERIIKLRERWEKREKELARRFEQRKSPSKGQFVVMIPQTDLEEPKRITKTKKKIKQLQ